MPSIPRVACRREPSSLVGRVRVSDVRFHPQRTQFARRCLERRPARPRPGRVAAVRVDREPGVGVEAVPPVPEGRGRHAGRQEDEAQEREAAAGDSQSHRAVMMMGGLKYILA